MPEPAERDVSSRPMRWPWLAALPCFALLSWLATRPAGLFDADAYYHLAVARLYAERGVIDALPWARFSLMHAMHGDKELLFHLLLAPLAWFPDMELGGQLALAALDTALALSLAYVAARAAGPRLGALAALLVMGTSATFALRVFRLRPELLSLLFMTWALHLLAQRRYFWAAAAAAVFCLSHTGFHSLIALLLSFAAWQYVAERELDWRALAAVVSGIGAGIVLHPHFPSNVIVFWAQNVSLFEHTAELDIGAELDSFTTASVLQMDAAWLLALLLLWASRVPATPAVGRELDALRRGARAFAVGALGFGLAFLHMGRFALYFVPFATLALLYTLAARAERVGTHLPLPGGVRAPLFPLLVPLCVAGLLNVLGTLYVNLQGNGAWTRARGDELRAIAQLLPPGAKVAAHWSNAEDYVFHAPQARYLNFLNPLFMYLPHPDLQRLWDAILRGDEPDVPERLAVDLDSEYVAFAAPKREALLERLANDPRMQSLHAGGEQLFRVRRDRSARFFTSWRVVPDGAPSAPAGGAYPVDRGPRGRGLAGYVDAMRVGALGSCVRFVHEREVIEPYARLVELAPWGSTELSIDDRPVAQLAAPQRARLGAGVALPLRLAPGRHVIAVRTCPHAGRAGFYLVERARLPLLDSPP